jgi:hypothetical protein
MAAPPKALDEDEIKFLEEVSAQEKASERKRQEEEEKELAAFGEAIPTNLTTNSYYSR